MGALLLGLSCTLALRPGGAHALPRLQLALVEGGAHAVRRGMQSCDSPCADVDCGARGACWEGACYCNGGYSNPNTAQLPRTDGCTVAEEPATVLTLNYPFLRVPGDRPTIRDAVEAYMVYPNEATVAVAPGRYTGLRNTNIRLHGKRVRIVAAEDATSTTVSCHWLPDEVRPTGAVRRVIEAFLDSSIDGGPNSAVAASGLEGFTMRDCGSVGTSGGAISVTSGAGLTVKRSVLENNTAENGGGVYVSAGTMVLETTVIVNNTARSNGGAVYVGAGAVATLTTVMVRYNTAGALGGGIYSDRTTFTMSNLLVTANTAHLNAGGLYDFGPSTLSAHRTIVSHNTGNPTGLYCVDAGLSTWVDQSDPDCFCDTGNQLSCSALQRAEFFDSGTRFSVYHRDASGATIYPTEVSVGLARFHAAAADVQSSTGRPREYTWGLDTQEWEFCPDSRDVANTPKVHRLTISNLESRQYIERIEVYDGKHASHPLIGSFTHAGDYEVYSTGLGDTDQLENGSDEMTEAISNWRGGCLYVRLIVEGGSDAVPFTPMVGGFDLKFEPVSWCFSGDLSSCGGVIQGTCLPQRICQCSPGYDSVGSHCSIEQFSVSFLNVELFAEPPQRITRMTMMVSSIKAAVDVAIDGDVLVLEARRYTGLENSAVSLGDKTITLRGAGPLKTIIDCEGSSHGFSIDSRTAPQHLRSNVTITLESLTIENCVAHKGGGLSAIGSRVILRNINIQRCSSTSIGEESQEHDQEVVDGGGGGAFFHSSIVKLVDVIFSGNRVVRPPVRSWSEVPSGRSTAGPAMRLVGQSTVSMVNTFVYDNIVCASDGPACVDLAIDRCNSVSLDGTRETCEAVEGGGCSYSGFVGRYERCSAPDGANALLQDLCAAVQVDGVASTCRFEGQNCEYQPKVTTVAETCTATHAESCSAVDLSASELTTEASRIDACVGSPGTGAAWSCGYIPECVAAADEISCDGSSSTDDTLCNCCNGCHKPLPQMQPDTATIVASESIADTVARERLGSSLQSTIPISSQEKLAVVLQGHGLAYGPNSTALRATFGGDSQDASVASVSTARGSIVGTTPDMIILSTGPEFSELSPPKSLWLQMDDSQEVVVPIFKQAGVRATIVQPAVTTDNGREAVLSLHLLSRPAADTGPVTVRVTVPPIFVAPQYPIVASLSNDNPNVTTAPTVASVLMMTCPNASTTAAVDAAGVHTGWPNCNTSVPDVCGCWFQPAVAKPMRVHFDHENWQVVQEVTLVGQNDMRSRVAQPYLNWTVTVEAPLSKDVVYSAAIGNVPAQHLSLRHLAFSCPRQGEVPNSNGTACLCDVGWEMRRDSTVCSRCLNGFFKITHGNFECSPCSDDPYQMKLMDTAGVIGSISRSRCLCKPGSYLLRGQDGEHGLCWPCEEGAVCTAYDTALDQIETAPGFWRAASDATQFYKCPILSQCVGSSMTRHHATPDAAVQSKTLNSFALDLCSEQSSGPLCASCNPGYARHSRRAECNACTKTVTYTSFAAMILLYVVVCGVFAFLSATTYKHEDSNTSMLMKTLISFLVNSRAIYSLRNPTAWEEGGSTAAVAVLFNLEAGLSTVSFGDTETFNCVLALLPSDASKRSELIAMIYAILPLPLFLLPSLATLVRWRFIKPSTLPHPSSANYDEIMNIVPRLQDQLIAIIVALCWFIWPALLENGLQPLLPSSCLTLPHETAVGADRTAVTRMRQELSIVCTGDTNAEVYNRIAVASWCSVVLWGVGFPLIAAAMLLHAHRRKATSLSTAASKRGWVTADSGGLGSRTTQRRFSFIYFGYAAKFWWWEGVVTLRKLSVVLVVLLTVDKQATDRAAVMISVLLVFLFLHIMAWPMVNSLIGFAETAQLLVSIFTACAMLLFISLDSAAGADNADLSVRRVLTEESGELGARRTSTVHLGWGSFGVHDGSAEVSTSGTENSLVGVAVICVNCFFLLWLFGAMCADIYRDKVVSMKDQDIDSLDAPGGWRGKLRASTIKAASMVARNTDRSETMRMEDTFTLRSVGEDEKAERAAREVDMVRLMQRRRASVTRVVLSPENMEESAEVAADVLQRTVVGSLGVDGSAGAARRRVRNARHDSAVSPGGGGRGLVRAHLAVRSASAFSGGLSDDGTISNHTDQGSTKESVDRIAELENEVSVLRGTVKSLRKQNVLAKIGKSVAQQHAESTANDMRIAQLKQQFVTGDDGRVSDSGADSSPDGSPLSPRSDGSSGQQPVTSRHFPRRHQATAGDASTSSNRVVRAVPPDDLDTARARAKQRFQHGIQARKPKISRAEKARENFFASLRVDNRRTVQHLAEQISSGDAGGDGTANARLFAEASEEVLLAAERQSDTKRFIEGRLQEHGEWFEQSKSEWRENEEARTSHLQTVTAAAESDDLAHLPRGMRHGDSEGDGSEESDSDDGAGQQQIRKPEQAVPLPGALPFDGPPRSGAFVMP